MKRKTYIKTGKWVDDYDEVHNETLVASTGTAANIISSETNITGIHLPLFDFDFPCKLIKSSTKGHFHLYVNKPVAWIHLYPLIIAMRNAGLLDVEWANIAIRDKQMLLRTANTKKIKSE